MRKIILTLTLIICMFSFVGCQNNSQRIRELNINNTDVAVLTIFADNGDSESSFLYKNYGHSFLSIENVSLNNFVVGDRIVLPNETITIGLWPIKEHFGIWFNVESNYINEYNKYSERVSISVGINLDDIAKVSKIIDENDNWTPMFNCSSFSLKVWNSVAQDSEKLNVGGFISPNNLVKEIKLFKNYEIARECKTTTNISYYKEG